MKDKSKNKGKQEHDEFTVGAIHIGYKELASNVLLKAVKDAFKMKRYGMFGTTMASDLREFAESKIFSVLCEIANVEETQVRKAILETLRE